MTSRATLTFGASLFALLGASCHERRSAPIEAPVFDADVAPVLALHCVSCHGDVAPAAGWSATSYLGAIACVAPSGEPATVRRGSAAPIVAALATSPHVGLLDPDEASLLARWINAGAPAFRGTVHEPGIVDPRSAAFHGAALRSERWTPMLDGNGPEACGRCHEGAPRPAGVTSSAPGATACTSCHTEPGGVLACGTCHGDGARSSPPRDPCFFPNDAAKAGAHAIHVDPSPASSQGIPCSACHPAPPKEVIGGAHGNGNVEIVFDPSRVGAEASYDATTHACAVGCHDRGGTEPRPVWSEVGTSTCNSCHTSPPKDHFKGACTLCHAEANAQGTSLKPGSLHVNGRVDLGDGTGGCGACHGKGADAWPSTGAHQAHKNPRITVAIDCSSCHVVPASLFAKGHLDSPVSVAFAGRALDRGALPAWDGASCSDVACHGAKLVDPPAVTPLWSDTSGAASVCGACHGLPPTQHTPSTSCDAASCHGGEVERDSKGIPSITMAGKALHINGLLNP